MPLTEADIARIEQRGHRREDFMVLDDELVPQLRNDRGHCVFLVEAKCSIYEDRPEGCRLYPLVWDRDTNQVVRDDFCPYTNQFPKTLQQEAAVRRVLATLRQEAANRRAA
jgi:uncharacterized protein